MAEVAVNFSGPWAGDPLPDNYYQKLSTPWGGGGVVSGGAIGVDSSATAFTIAPFRVVAGGRIVEQTSTLTLTPQVNSSGASRLDTIVLHIDPVAKRATVRTINTTPVRTPGADGIFDVVLGSGRVFNTAPLVRSTITAPSMAGRTLRGVTYTDDLAGLPLSAGDTAWEGGNSRLRVYDGDTWKPPVEDVRQQFLNGDRYLAFSSPVQDNRRLGIWQTDFPARKGGLYLMHSTIEVLLEGNVRVDYTVEGYDVGGTPFTRGYAIADQTNNGATTPGVRSYMLNVSAFVNWGTSPIRWRGSLQRIAGDGRWRNSAFNGFTEWTYQPTDLPPLAMNNTMPPNTSL